MRWKQTSSLFLLLFLSLFNWFFNKCLQIHHTKVLFHTFVWCIWLFHTLKSILWKACLNNIKYQHTSIFVEESTIMLYSPQHAFAKTQHIYTHDLIWFWVLFPKTQCTTKSHGTLIIKKKSLWSSNKPTNNIRHFSNTF